MSDVVTIALIAAAPGILATIVSLFNNFAVRHQSSTISSLEKNTNSIKDALVRVTGESAFAAGLKIGRESAIGATGAQGERGDIGPRGDVGPKGN